MGNSASLDMFEEGQLERELAETVNKDESLFQIANGMYDEVVDSVIRPPRDPFLPNVDLGPSNFRRRRSGRHVCRTDFSLDDGRGGQLACSWWHFGGDLSEISGSRGSSSSGSSSPGVGRTPGTSAGRRRPCVLYAHRLNGNRSCAVRSGCLSFALELGWTLCSVDLTGAGASAGPYVSWGYYEQQDLLVVLRYLLGADDSGEDDDEDEDEDNGTGGDAAGAAAGAASAVNNSHHYIDGSAAATSRPRPRRASRVGVWGCSTGAAAALFLAARQMEMGHHPSSPGRLAFLVADSVYSSFEACVKSAAKEVRSETGVGIPSMLISSAVRMICKSVTKKLEADFALADLSPLVQAGGSGGGTGVPAFFAVPDESLFLIHHACKRDGHAVFTQYRKTDKAFWPSGGGRKVAVDFAGADIDEPRTPALFAQVARWLERMDTLLDLELDMGRTFESWGLEPSGGSGGGSGGRKDGMWGWAGVPPPPSE